MASINTKSGVLIPFFSPAPTIQKTPACLNGFWFGECKFIRKNGKRKKIKPKIHPVSSNNDVTRTWMYSEGRACYYTATAIQYGYTNKNLLKPLLTDKSVLQ